MGEFKIGDIIKVKVIGIQHYGIFIKCMDNEEYTGLIHISEISTDFVKDVNKVAKLNDILFAKVLDIDEPSKHVKLSIKASKPKVRYRYNYVKVKANPKNSDFAPLKEKLSSWINEELEERENDQG